jgi:formamidopyrimidine-DNA glycosylase
MPELPEVENVRRGLEKALKDHPKVTEVELKRKDLRCEIPVKKVRSLVGEKITAVDRRAKYLLLRTKKGSFLSHLGMTGTWRVAKPGDERLHDHIYLHFSNGLRLAYRDPRRFGCFDFVALDEEQTHPRLKSLGPEPLSSAFTGSTLHASFRGKQVAVKVALMDQKVVVGVGNIYANEALFRAKVRPQTLAGKLSLAKCAAIVEAIRSVLQESIDAGGSSINDYENLEGASGEFQNSFQVYDRKGQPCCTCGKPISAETLGGRSTFWCRNCQK